MVKQDAVKLVILKRRADFLRCRNGLRWAGRAFVIEAKTRCVDDSCRGPGKSPPRFGFTVTKQLGNAVRRNRIRRRLKAAAKSAAVTGARTGFDYVIFARSACESYAFLQLEAEFAKAMAGIHRPASATGAKAVAVGKPQRA